MSNTVSTWQPKEPTITLTEAAIFHVQKQLEKQGHGVGLRFGVKKSGCSGYAYQVDLIDTPKEDEKVIPVNDKLIVAVPNKDLPVLQGTEIDYIKEGVNQRFQFNNPNETASCGCGESFSVDKTDKSN